MSEEITIFLGTLFIIFLAIVFIAYALEFNKRRHRHHREKELMNAQFQQELLSSQLEIQEHTFQTISQEIHDNIGQMLTLVKLNLNAIDLDSKADATEKLDNAKETLAKTIQDLRDISKTLNSDTISEVGIAKAIEMELNVISKVAKIQTSFDCNQTPENIDPQVELILFRVIQEALHNIIKHARATIIKVMIKHSGKNLALQIKDNGVGFDLNSNDKNGSGLNNMKNRCKLIKATFDMRSDIGKGTEVSVDLPLLLTSYQ